MINLTAKENPLRTYERVFLNEKLLFEQTIVAKNKHQRVKDISTFTFIHLSIPFKILRKEKNKVKLKVNLIV
ncbi:CLUMA_CG009694, isoform A [Clunio marinus]|uniref:CLUMA_CG009694, isoform A n=1 Tax=Clunio marinus TaxID=568069 RepID=A0A1J1I7N7_9DIPT|nr:CLUMA_CG009694, isoform A [Clunio marinus]